VNDPEMREGLGDALYTLTVPGWQVGIYPIFGGSSPPLGSRLSLLIQDRL
jgi:hypothetical protein